MTKGTLIKNGIDYSNGGGGDSAIEITKEQYDKLSDEELKDKTYFIIDWDGKSTPGGGTPSSFDTIDVELVPDGSVITAIDAAKTKVTKIPALGLCVFTVNCTTGSGMKNWADVSINFPSPVTEYAGLAMSNGTGRAMYFIIQPNQHMVFTNPVSQTIGNGEGIIFSGSYLYDTTEDE